MRQLCCGRRREKEARTGTTIGTATGASTNRGTVTTTGALTDVGSSAAAAVLETVTATGASGTVTATGALTDVGSSADAAVPETAILEVNEVGYTVIYEGEEPLLAE